MTPKILVLGEVFTDRYFIGTADRLSPEAPLPVVKVSEVINKPGGAGNVAANCRALGAEVRTIDPPYPYPVKNRLIANGHQIARWDQDDQVASYTTAGLRIHTADFEWADGIIISDYCKGAFGPGIINTLAAYCDQKVVYIDTKRNPEIYSNFRNKLFFPNLKEHLNYITAYTQCTHVLRKESAEGMSYFLEGQPVVHVPTYTINPISVSGAGDTVIAAYAYAEISGMPGPKERMIFASKAAAVAIGKPLTSVANLDEIKNITT